MRGKGKKALSPSQFRRWSPCANKLTRGFFLLALLVLLAAIVFVVVAVVVAVVAVGFGVVVVVVIAQASGAGAEAGASGFVSLTLGAAIAEAVLAAAALPGQSASALAGASVLPGFHRAREWGRGAKRSCLFADEAGLAELDGGQRRMALESSSFLFKTSFERAKASYK